MQEILDRESDSVLRSSSQEYQNGIEQWMKTRQFTANSLLFTVLRRTMESYLSSKGLAALGVARYYPSLRSNSVEEIHC